MRTILFTLVIVMSFVQRDVAAEAKPPVCGAQDFDNFSRDLLIGRSIKKWVAACPKFINIPDGLFGIPPLSWLMTTQSTPQIEFFLKNGARINAQCQDGYTALMYAAYRGNAEAVSMLLKNNADVSLKNKKGETALDLALSGPEISPAIVHALYTKGARCGNPCSLKKHLKY